MTEPNPSGHNPALKALEVLVGTWEMELSNASFLPDSSATIKAQVSFEWVEQGAFLCLRMGDNALWLISRDDSRPDYQVFYYDARSVSRIYAMRFAEQVWTMWRNAPGFSQRYEGTISADGQIITARWEKSSDGATWEHDFDLTYTKVSQAR